MIIYFLNLLLAFICIPYLFFAIKKLRATIPVLPNAEDLEGLIGNYKNTKSLLFLGESAIAGVGVKSNNEALAGQLSDRLSTQYDCNIKWEVLAHTGYDSQQVIDKLLPQLKDEPYDLILIQLCVNDTLKLIPPVYYSLRIEQIINHLKQKYPKSKLLFVNNAPIRDMSFPFLVSYILGNIIDQYAHVLADLVAQHEDLYFISDKLQYSEWQKRYPDIPREDFFSDGVHPSAFTYAQWAEDICAFIVKEEIITLKE